jgi:hypothetical protein
LSKEDFAFLLHEWIGNWICPCDAQSFEEGFVGEPAQESFACILNKEVENDEGTELSVKVSVFSILSSQRNIVMRRALRRRTASCAVRDSLPLAR